MFWLIRPMLLVTPRQCAVTTDSTGGASPSTTGSTLRKRKVMPVEDQAFSVRILKYENLCPIRTEGDGNAQRSKYQADDEPGAPGGHP